MIYKIIKCHNNDVYEIENKLEEDVNYAIENGYKPYGGVAIATETHGCEVWYTVCQAMIKE